jgi:hypothetical protein
MGDVARGAPADMDLARRAIASVIARDMATAPGARSASSTAIAPDRISTRISGVGFISFFFKRSI